MTYTFNTPNVWLTARGHTPVLELFKLTSTRITRTNIQHIMQESGPRT